MKRERTRARWRVGLAVLVVAGTGACAAGMKQEEVMGALAGLKAELQEEMRAGDARVAADARQEMAALADSLRAGFAAFEVELEGVRQSVDVKISQAEARLSLSMPIHFAFDDATIRPSDVPVLDRFVGIVKTQLGGAVITLEGFTDRQGSVEYNKILGRKRAEAVRDYLVAAGLSSDQLKIASYGEAADRQVNAAAFGPGEAGMVNRRVGFVIEHGAAVGPMVARGESGR